MDLDRLAVQWVGGVRNSGSATPSPLRVAKGCHTCRTFDDTALRKVVDTSPTPETAYRRL
jgi:hypothetical protein